MLAIGFWNIEKADGANIVAGVVELAVALATDPAISGPNGDILLCLGEPGTLDIVALQHQLDLQATGHGWWCEKSLSGRFVTVGTIDQATRSFPEESSGCLATSLSRVNGQDPIFTYELWFVHLESPMGAENSTVVHMDVAGELREAVDKREVARANTATIAIGDFNMPPYSPGMTSPTKLNAAACKTAAGKVSRIVRDTKHRFFFNPMWEILGSRSPNQQPGSFYKRYRDNSIFWHLYDQVLVRPELIDRIVSGSPKVLTTAGATNLLTSKGGINRSFSDHLPITISLAI